MSDLYKNLNKEVENDLAGKSSRFGLPRRRAGKLFLLFLLFAAIGGAVWLGVSAFSAAFGKTENQNAAARNQKAETEKAANNFSFGEMIKLPFAKEAELKKDESGRTNILILGMSGEGYESPELTDTILIASLNFADLTAEKKINLVSLPRDLWVEIPGFGYFGKLNSLYVLGKNRAPENPFALITAKISEITGITPQYSLAVDVSALSRVVDSLGGINVWVEKDLRDPGFPPKNFGTEVFEIKQGWRYFDGQTAAKYVRSRHTAYGDFDRIKRQQQVLLALKNKAAGLNPIYDLPKFFALFETIKNNIATDLDLPEIKSLWNLSKDFGPNDLKGIVIDGDVSKNLIISGTAETSSGRASILYPLEGFEKYEKIKEYILSNF
ncbi:MAG: LCP family protein [Patescibacteria group bacterium]